MIRTTKPSQAQRHRDARGFTLIELVVVLAIVGLLLTIALPRYISTLDRGKEQVLKQNLYQMREALDKFYGDNGKYPDKLEELVARRYLRAIPIDPFSESTTWLVIAPKDPELGGVYDVQSTLTGSDGQPRTLAADAEAHGPVATNGAAPAPLPSEKTP